MLLDRHQVKFEKAVPLLPKESLAEIAKTKVGRRDLVVITRSVYIVSIIPYELRHVEHHSSSRLRQGLKPKELSL